MFYWALNGDKQHGWGQIPGAKLKLLEMPEDWMDTATDKAVEKLSLYLSGAIQPQPANSDSCRYCDFRNGCRVDEAEKKTLTAGVPA